MTLRRQLFLILSFLFLVLLMVVLWASVSATRRYLEQQLASHAQDAATAMSVNLQQTLVKGDRIVIEMQVNSLFDRGYFRRIEVRGPDRALIVGKELPESIAGVPLWFSRMLPIDTAPGEAHISSGWRQLGKVVVVSQPTIAYQYLWHSALELAGWIGVVFAGSLVLMQVLLRFVLEPLHRIEQSARAVQEKRFEQIDLAPRAPELGRVVVAMNDMSRRVAEILDAEAAQAEALRKAAYQDDASGLANRRGFDLRLNELLGNSGAFARGIMVVVDFEEMAALSRTHGFPACLTLIRGTVAAAREAFAANPPAVEGRTNEYSFSFVVLDPADDFAVQAERLREKLAALVDAGPGAGLVDFAIGTAWFDSAAKRSDLFAKADLAVESARHAGRYRLFLLPERSHESAALGSFAWGKLIKDALQENRWILAAQPVVQLEHPDRPIHSELMARLVDQKGNLLPASNFLPMAARHRMMPDVDRALVTLGLEYLGRHGTTEHVALNLSHQGTADSEFIRWLDAALAGLGALAARRLSVELSEFACLKNIEATRRLQDLLRQRGVRFGIDNFGLDAQAVPLLRQSPPDYIKLAGALAGDFGRDEQVRGAVLSLVQLAGSLDLPVYAQNVESIDQSAALLAAGITGGQGYLFGAPA